MALYPLSLIARGIFVPIGMDEKHMREVSATGGWLRQGVINEEIRLQQGGDLVGSC